jgi:FtsH-binding integral membrane protein
MIYLSIALFALSAVLGLAILLKWLSKKDASKAVIYSHGIVAVAGLTLLLVYAMQHPENFPKASIILFAVAAIAGLYMFILDLQKKFSPMALAFTHAFVAVAGFLMLLFFAFAS